MLLIQGGHFVKHMIFIYFSGSHDEQNGSQSFFTSYDRIDHKVVVIESLKSGK